MHALNCRAEELRVRKRRGLAILRYDSGGAARSSKIFPGTGTNSPFIFAPFRFISLGYDNRL